MGMKKLGPISSIVMLTVAVAAIVVGIYLKARGTLTWDTFTGWMVSTFLLAAIFGFMVLRDIQAKWWT